MDGKKLFSLAFEAHRLYWLAHIRSKTEDFSAHLAFKDAYEKTGEIFHSVGERSEDNGSPIDESDWRELAAAARDATEKLLVELSKSVPSATAGETKVLTDAASDAEDVLGTTSQFSK